MTHLAPHEFLRQSLGQRRQLVADIAIRQLLLEPLHTRVRHLGIPEEVQPLQLLQAGQFFQPRVRHLGTSERRQMDEAFLPYVQGQSDTAATVCAGLITSATSCGGWRYRTQYSIGR